MADGLSREALDRRFPQIVGTYVVISWGLVQFVDWLVGRYTLSSHLVDFVGAALLLLVPSVAIIAWLHGKPGRDHWTIVEKVAVPANLIAGAILLWIVFAGRDLGSAVTTVVVADDEGNEVERAVPKAAFRRHIAVFNYDNRSGDPELDWIQYALPQGVVTALAQNPFVEVRFGPHMAEDQREAGFEDGLGLPLTLELKLADDQHLEAIVSGELNRSADTLVATTVLHDVHTGRVVSESRARGRDAFELADAIAAQLAADLELPSSPDQRQLPIREILTDSEPAYREYIEGYRRVVYEQDWQAAIEPLESAVAADPTFAVAHNLMFAVYLLGNQPEKSAEAISAAMDHSYRLPEFDRYAVRVNYFHTVRQDPQRALEVAETAAELFPDKVEAHVMRAQMYQLLDRRDDAIAALERVLELDPGQYDVVRQIGVFRQTQGRFDEALDLYAGYAELFPDDVRSHLAMGNVYWSMARHAESIDAFERALSIEPGYVEALVEIAGVLTSLGRFDEATVHYEDARRETGTPQQRAALAASLRGYFTGRGQIEKALEARAAEIEAMAASEGPVNVIARRLTTLDLYVLAGREQLAIDSVEILGRELQPPWNGLASLGEIEVYRTVEDADRLEGAIADANAFMDAIGFELFRFLAIVGEAQVLEFRDDCEGAIERYEAALALQPQALGRHRDIGRCLRKLGRYDEAIAQIQKALTVVPYSASSNHELARVYLAMDDPASAETHLRRAVEVWQDADPGFEPAREARQELARLTES